MPILVFRQLRFELARTILTILVIAGVIAEILILEGFLAGLYDQLRQAVLNRGGDLIVTQAGISNFIATRSIVPQTARLEIEEVEGVREAHPLTGISVIYEKGGRRTPIMVLVYDEAGGPTEISNGHAISGDREIIIDHALAGKYDLAPGDLLEISEFEFRVAGISVNTSAFLTPFAFIKYDDLIDFYFESDIAADIATFPLLSFLLVEIDPAFDPGEVAAGIEERIETVDVFLPDELSERDEDLGRELMGPILGLLLFVSYGIGILVVGMFMFMAVRGRLRNLGVLKALGFRVRTLGYAVLFEAILLTLLALPFGVLLAGIIAKIIHRIAPIYLVLATEPDAIARTAIACLAIATLGAFIPVRAIKDIDPAIVFRS
jgi:ABC-type antimicrobial peptide transport system permease subunit